jgi:hypothetical protein
MLDFEAPWLEWAFALQRQSGDFISLSLPVSFMFSA